MMAMPSSSRRSMSRSSTCAWMVTSSAGGLTAMSSLGRQAATWRSSQAGAGRRRAGAIVVQPFVADGMPTRSGISDGATALGVMTWRSCARTVSICSPMNTG
jgi:hypothetical protein